MSVYLDHHAATPPCPQALAAMDEARELAWANPSSTHGAGRRARALLERAREQVAAALGANEHDVVLTAGGTEACNLGVLGLEHPAHVVTTTIEHPAVARAVDRLERSGSRVTRLGVSNGIIPDAATVARVITDEPTLLATQWVNHETGSLLPVEPWSRAARERGARVFVDATQALGKRPVDVEALAVDALAVASHKLGGPAGAGALWVRRGTPLSPVLEGGEQERGRRPGTPDVTSAAGFGAACAALDERLEAMAGIGARRDRLEAALCERGGRVNGAEHARVETVVDASMPGWRGELLAAALDLEGVFASSGAACSSGTSEPSPVVRAMYPDEPWRAASTLRLSLGPEVDDASVAFALAALERVLARGVEASSGF